MPRPSYSVTRYAMLLCLALIIIINAADYFAPSYASSVLFDVFSSINLRGNVGGASIIIGLVAAAFATLHEWKPAPDPKLQRPPTIQVADVELGLMKRNLKNGDCGEDVREAEIALVQRGYVLKVDGVFDEEMENVVKQFQTKEKLDQDGIIGPRTRFKLGLFAKLDKNSKHS